MVIGGFGAPTVFRGIQIEDASVRLTHNLVLGGPGWQFGGNLMATTPVRVELSANIFDHDWHSIQFYFGRTDALQADDAKEVLKRLFRWQQEQDVATLRGKEPVFAQVRGTRATGEPVTIVQFNSLAAWKQLWDLPDAAVVGGKVNYQITYPRQKVRDAPEQVTPQDFRLRADSAGYRAGKDGKDLGPDVDLVGPGAAYDRWKKTPAYQQWLKDTAHVK
jgi:hypothetical protein